MTIMRGILIAFIAVISASPMEPVLASYSHASARSETVPSIEGVMIVTDVSLFQESGVEPFSGVHFRGEPIAETELEKAAASFVGQELTIDKLNNLTADLTLALDQAGYSVVDVAVPEQDVRGGAIQVVIRIGVLGRVLIEGNKHFSDESFNSLLSAGPGDKIHTDTIKRDLIAINTNPYRQADVVFQRGEGLGETDIVLNVSDRRPFRVFASYANNGVSSTGLNRFSAGAGYGNLWGRGHVADIQFSISDDGESYWSVGGSYVVPLRRGHTLSISGDFVRTNIAANEFFETRGGSRRLEAKYSVPLKSFNLRRGDTFLIDMTHEFSSALQYKRFNNTIEFGGVDVFQSAPEVFQFVGDYALSLEDELGAWNLSLRGVYSPGGVTNANSDEFFNLVREGASAEYAYVNVGLSRVIRLPFMLSFVARAQTQFSNGPLVAPEQFAIGGAGTVRGYQEATSLGDEGYFASAELRSPLWSPRIGRLAGASGDDQLQALVFFNIGDVWDNGVRTVSGDTHNLTSAGFGLRYRYAPNFTIQADLGFQLRDELPRMTADDDRYAHVSITFSY